MRCHFYGAGGCWLGAGIGRGARGDWASGGASRNQGPPEEKPEVCHLTSGSPSEDSSYFFNANDLRAFNRICIAAYIYY